MSFFVAPNEDAGDLIAERMAEDPVFADRYEAIKELRALDDGTLHKGNEFRRVASIQGPLLDLEILLDADFMQNKRKFYAWLDAHPQHCTYDRRTQRGSGQTADGHGMMVPELSWKVAP
jgi:hypothetical protein